MTCRLPGDESDRIGATVRPEAIANIIAFPAGTSLWL
jgi:hypothetical protein